MHTQCTTHSHNTHIQAIPVTIPASGRSFSKRFQLQMAFILLIKCNVANGNVRLQVARFGHKTGIKMCAHSTQHTPNIYAWDSEYWIKSRWLFSMILDCWKVRCWRSYVIIIWTRVLSALSLWCFVLIVHIMWWWRWIEETLSLLRTCTINCIIHRGYMKMIQNILIKYVEKMKFPVFGKWICARRIVLWPAARMVFL